MKLAGIILIIQSQLGTLTLPGFKTMEACREAATAVQHGVLQNGESKVNLAGVVKSADCQVRK